MKVLMWLAAAFAVLFFMLGLVTEEAGFHSASALEAAGAFCIRMGFGNEY